MIKSGSAQRLSKRHESTKQNLIKILALPPQKRGACAHLAPTCSLTLIEVLGHTLSKTWVRALWGVSVDGFEAFFEDRNYLVPLLKCE